MTNQPPKKKQKQTSKPIFRTASPYEKYNILPIDQPIQDQVVDLLISILKSIGEHHASKPKSRGKKRRTKGKKGSQADGHEIVGTASVTGAADSTPKSLSKENAEQHVPATERPEPAPPSRSVLIGFNAVTRHLEALSRLSRPPQFQTATPEIPPPESHQNIRSPTHVAAVFLFRPLDDLIYSHLPLLCQTASLASPQLPGTRLVLLDAKAESQVAEALRASPKTSLLAVLDDTSDSMDKANDTKELIEYVREHVEAVEVPWLKPAVDARWLSVKIDTQQN